MIITRFTGYSGSRVELVKENDLVFVRKTGNVSRNLERLTELKKHGLPVTSVLKSYNDIIEIEYVHGVDMVNYLQRNRVDELAEFLVSVINILRAQTSTQDYTQVYLDKFNDINWQDFDFSQQDLLDRLPKLLPKSLYYGDLTLENIIYSQERGFVLIDAATIEYDSYIFDLAKLNQDLVAKWFIRFKNINLDYKLQSIGRILTDNFGNIDPSLIISQLLRVYRHADRDPQIKLFLKERIGELWKL